MDDGLMCIVEIPKGSRNKYEWDPERRIIVLDRYLSSSVVFPTDYGFIEQTIGEEGDPLDVLVAVSEPTFPGCGIVAKPIGVLFLRDGEDREPKVLCVPCEDPNWQEMRSAQDVPTQLREEIEHFFVAYKRREGKEVQADGWEDADRAREIVADAERRFAQEHSD
ncbi:MAG: inorganic diphosphatase [Actinomycetota bacterium]|nr:inorganic diphosphatase [Actinomycetota bacterium]